MSAGTVVRWSLAAVVFAAIGLVSMRFGHGVGFGLLMAALLFVFILDVAARRGERRASSDGPEGG